MKKGRPSWPPAVARCCRRASPSHHRGCPFAVHPPAAAAKPLLPLSRATARR
ncbi:hypothetical protein SESBI_27068 [Sesbania bispinosa]|nr:hypothetical protein SESBI_27068 [Sesbania bispinosa]